MRLKREAKAKKLGKPVLLPLDEQPEFKEVIKIIKEINRTLKFVKRVQIVEEAPKVEKVEKMRVLTDGTIPEEDEESKSST